MPLVLNRRDERKAEKLARLLAALDDTARLTRPSRRRRHRVSLGSSRF
jgi:hypothetical protein